MVQDFPGAELVERVTILEPPVIDVRTALGEVQLYFATHVSHLDETPTELSLWMTPEQARVLAGALEHAAEKV